MDYAITIVEYIDRLITHAGNWLDWASQNGIAEDCGRVIGLGFRYFWDSVLPVIAKWLILLIEKGGYIN